MSLQGSDASIQLTHNAIPIVSVLVQTSGSVKFTLSPYSVVETQPVEEPEGWVSVGVLLHLSDYSVIANDSMKSVTLGAPVVLDDYTDSLELVLSRNTFWRSIRLLKPSRNDLSLAYYQAYSRRTLLPTFVSGGASLIDLELRRLLTVNNTYIGIERVASHLVQFTSAGESSYSFVSEDQANTTDVVCTDSQMAIRDGACVVVENLVLGRAGASMQIALTDPLESTPLTVGFYFCLSPTTASFTFFSLKGNVGSLGLFTDNSAHLNLLTDNTHDLGAQVPIGVWQFAIFSTDFTSVTGSRAVDIYVGQSIHFTTPGGEYTDSIFSGITLEGGVSSFANIVLQRSLFSDFGEAKRML